MTARAFSALIVVTYAYDHRGRMIRKDIMRTGSVTVHIEYLWDGWNIIREELRTPHAQLRTTHNLWGLDLDGTMQGAGGVGGLLAVVRDGETYIPTYDANGNVSEYIGSSDGSVAAHYDYSPFGETLVASGPLAASFTHRFSTKPYCHATGFCEYQMRKYRPDIGRWMSRDPIGERWDRNIYCFTANLPTTRIDLLGLLVVYIGGAMEETQGDLSTFQKNVGADVSFGWDRGAAVVARIKKAIKANPCEPIILIGHSWGGDTTMDVADDLKGEACLKCLYVVTLDPVSQLDPDAWFGGPYPGNQVTEWINVAQPAGPMDVIVDIPIVGWIIGGLWSAGGAIIGNNDVIATGGGQWNSEPQATFDIPAVDPNGNMLDHHDVGGMMNLTMPGKSETIRQYIEHLKERNCCDEKN